MVRILIVEARFYPEIADEMLLGARAALDAAGARHETVTVPGALEIPIAIRRCLGQADGFVALGCVIRGETSHYDIVAGESARGLMTLGIESGIAIGNGILTCDNWDQAMARAKVDGEHNKGGGAANACLSLLSIANKTGERL